MTKDIQEIRTKLIEIQSKFLGPLKVKVDKPSNFELSGTIPAMQGKAKVDGYYFSSVVPKDKDVRLYFFPAYTHASDFEGLSETMKKFKKGKSCFHIKYLDEQLEAEVESMVKKAIKLYQNDGILAK